MVRCQVAVALACTTLVACLPEPKSEVQWGSRWTGEPMRVVLLPASCASVSGDCDDASVQGVQGLVASELEFGRYAVADAEKLVASARSRQDVDVELSRFGEQLVAVRSRAQAGSVFEDLSPAQRRALLAEARAEGIVSVRVQIGVSNGGTRENDVQVRLGLGDGGELAWVARCTAPSSWNGSPSLAQSLETAARCALGRALEKPAAAGR